MKEKGFTIIELIETLGIIAILGAIALPLYNKYTTKTRVTEALHAGQVYARKVQSEAGGGGDAGEIPVLEYATISRTGSGNVIRVEIALKTEIDSDVVFRSNEMAGGKALVLIPESAGGAGRWVCRTDLPSAFTPKVCTYSATPGAVRWSAGDDACWNQAYADAAGSGNGWVVGLTTGTTPWQKTKAIEFAASNTITAPSGWPSFAVGNFRCTSI